MGQRDCPFVPFRFRLRVKVFRSRRQKKKASPKVRFLVVHWCLRLRTPAPRHHRRSSRCSFRTSSETRAFASAWMASLFWLPSFTTSTLAYVWAASEVGSLRWPGASLSTERLAALSIVAVDAGDIDIGEHRAGLSAASSSLILQVQRVFRYIVRRSGNARTVLQLDEAFLLQAGAEHAPRWWCRSARQRRRLPSRSLSEAVFPGVQTERLEMHGLDGNEMRPLFLVETVEVRLMLEVVRIHLAFFGRPCWAARSR